MRTCASCQEVKQVAEFARDKSNKKDGLKYSCRSCVTLKNKAFYEKNKERELNRVKVYRAGNPERISQLRKLSRQADPARFTAYRKTNSLNNPDAMLARSAKNRASKKGKVPSWLTPDDYFLIREAFHLALLRKKMFGFTWHVDHVIPLKGKLVCGLHVPENLQVIPSTANKRKHNKYEVAL